MQVQLLQFMNLLQYMMIWEYTESSHTETVIMQYMQCKFITEILKTVYFSKTLEQPYITKENPCKCLSTCLYIYIYSELCHLFSVKVA